MNSTGQQCRSRFELQISAGCFEATPQVERIFQFCGGLRLIDELQFPNHAVNDVGNIRDFTIEVEMVDGTISIIDVR